jgi:hypothetical protein
MNQSAKPQRQSRLTPRVGALSVGALLFCVYAGAYFIRSRDGRFEPWDWGTNGVKTYCWAPAGFVTNLKRDHSQTLFYYPLWLIDIRFWHTSDKAYDSKYPINKIRTEDLDNTYRMLKDQP